MCKYAVYVVMFDDGRIKVGISANPEKRMKYFAQEVRRNFGSYLSWFACKPFEHKRHALYTETAICRWLSEASIPGHREWFAGATVEDFEAIMEQVEQFRSELATEIGEEKKDIPWFGSSGYFRNEVAA